MAGGAGPLGAPFIQGTAQARSGNVEGAGGSFAAGLVPFADPAISGLRELAPAAADTKAAMRSALPGSNLEEGSIQHLWGTANDMGLKPEDFARDNPKAAANLKDVVDTSQTKLQQNHTALVDPIREVPKDAPPLAEGVRNKLAQTYKDANPGLADRIRSGKTTVGDLETVRGELNRTFDDATYTSPEKTVLQQWGKQVRSSVYDEIAKFHNLPDEAMSTLKDIQGDFLERSNKGALAKAVSRLQLQSDITAGSTVGRRIGAKVGGAVDLAKSPISSSAKRVLGTPGLAERLEVGMRGMKDAKPYSVPVSGRPAVQPPTPQAPPSFNLPTPEARPPANFVPNTFSNESSPTIQPQPKFGGEQPITGPSRLPTATPAAPELLPASEPALGKPAAGPAEGGAPQYTPQPAMGPQAPDLRAERTTRVGDYRSDTPSGFPKGGSAKSAPLDLQFKASKGSAKVATAPGGKMADLNLRDPAQPSPSNLLMGLSEGKSVGSVMIQGRPDILPGSVEVGSIHAYEEGKGHGMGLYNLALQRAVQSGADYLISDSVRMEGAEGSWKSIQRQHPDRVSQFTDPQGNVRYRMDLRGVGGKK